MVYIYIHMYHIQLAMWILQKAGFFIAKFFRLEEIFSNGSCEVREILETMKSNGVLASIDSLDLSAGLIA